MARPAGLISTLKPRNHQRHTPNTHQHTNKAPNCQHQVQPPVGLVEVVYKGLELLDGLFAAGGWSHKLQLSGNCFQAPEGSAGNLFRCAVQLDKWDTAHASVNEEVLGVRQEAVAQHLDLHLLRLALQNVMILIQGLFLSGQVERTSGGRSAILAYQVLDGCPAATAATIGHE